jgi:hypothetical protein
MLREFLHYAETGKIAAGNITGADFDSPFEAAVALVIRQAGYRAAPQVGVSGFRVDLGVLHPEQEGRFVLGVECDGATYHSGRSARIAGFRSLALHGDTGRKLVKLQPDLGQKPMLQAMIAQFSRQSGAEDLTDSFVMAAQALLAAQRSIRERRVVIMETSFPYLPL